MARIPEEVIDQVRNQADIVDIIGNYVQLKSRDEITLAYVLSTVKNAILFRITGKTDFPLFWLW